MELQVQTAVEMPGAAAAVLEQLQQRQHSGSATVLALHGDLGAGKTTFIQALAATLGVTEQLTSPTFVIMKQYETTHELFQRLVHIDAYRLESVDELAVLGFAELLEDQQTVICIEWAERVAEVLPIHTTDLTFTITADEARTITIDYGQES